LLLPIVSRSSGRSIDVADRTLTARELENAEREFRLLLASGEQHGEGAAAHALEGNLDSLSVFPALPRDVACAQAGAGTAAHLRIFSAEAGGRLTCQSRSSSIDMLRWKSGRARFLFSSDGENWQDGWYETASSTQVARGGSAAVTRDAPFVKFQLSQPDGRRVEWLARVGSTEATRIDPRGSQKSEPAK
jgi:hypothetical protein